MMALLNWKIGEGSAAICRGKRSIVRVEPHATASESLLLPGAA